MADDYAKATAGQEFETIPGQEFGPMGEHGVHMTLHDTTANAAPLGLMAFGLTTALVSVHNAGLIPLSGMLLAMTVFYGGMAQVIAGIMEWKKNSTFGMTAFLSFGCFWLTFAALFAFPKWIGSADLPLGATTTALGYYLLAWALFVGLMFFGALRINRALQVVFLTATALLLLLALGEWTGTEMFTKLGGWVGIVCGLSGVYASIAQVWNELYDREVLPLGPYKR